MRATSADATQARHDAANPTAEAGGLRRSAEAGQVEMTPDSARQAAQRVDRELCFALDDYDAATRASTASFEARFGDAVRSLGAD